MRFLLYFCFADRVSAATVLAHLVVADDCLRHDFGIPQKIEGDCVCRFPPP